MNVTIAEFLRTTKLGELRLGMPLSEVISCLGQPWKSTDDLPVDIWQFGDLEFLVQNELVMSIELTVDSDPVSLPPELEVEDLRAWSRRSIQSLEDWLTTVGLQTTNRFTASESTRWVLSSGAAVTMMSNAVNAVSVIDARIGS